MANKNSKATLIASIAGATCVGLLFLVTLGIRPAGFGLVLGWFVGSLIPDLFME